MHVEATATTVLFGAKLQSGASSVLGPSLATLWVMLKLSRAMVGHVEATKIHLRNAPPGPEGSNQKPSQNTKTPPKR